MIYYKFPNAQIADVVLYNTLFEHGQFVKYARYPNIIVVGLMYDKAGVVLDGWHVNVVGDVGLPGCDQYIVTPTTPTIQ